jgi:predicted RecA/RadA family phage recombinase
MSENRRSEGKLVSLQFCTAASNIPAGTPLGILTATNNVYTLGNTPVGFSCTANIGGHFIGIADEDISAGQSIFSVWVEGVFELTASSAWTTAYAGDPVMGDSGMVVVNAGSYTGQAPIGSYIPCPGSPVNGEVSGRAVLVKIDPVMWRWATFGVTAVSPSNGYVGDTWPQQL